MSRWKAIGWTVAFFVCGIAATFVVMMILGRLGVDTKAVWFGAATILPGFGLATWLVGTLGMKLTWSELRYREVGSQGKGFGIGMAVGAVPALLAMAIASPVGHAGWALDGGSFEAWLRAIGGLALILLPAAFAEELIFRGAGYVVLSKAFGRLGPAVALSVIFGAVHLGNPNVTLLAVANVALAGIFLSLAFWLPGGMYAATGAHLGWNLTLAAFGAPVSGIPFTLPMLDYVTGGPNWLTGGNFGPEGGVIATVIIGLTSAWLFRRTTPRIRSGQAPQAPRTEEA